MYVRVSMSICVFNYTIKGVALLGDIKIPKLVLFKSYLIYWRLILSILSPVN